MDSSHSHFRPRHEIYTRMVPPAVQKFLPPELAELVEDGLRLQDLHENQLKDAVLNDYSFIIFPLAKAYEGFLKILFFQIGVLQRDVYHARNFRIGRSFNPDLVQKLRDELWIYDDVAHLCGEEVARELWQIWLDARNHLFHFYPGDRYVLSSTESKVLIQRTLDVMNMAIAHPPKNPL